MSVFDLRNEMMAAYLREVEGREIKAVYVVETTENNFRVYIHEADESHYSETYEMGHVMAWIWSKVK